MEVEANLKDTSELGYEARPSSEVSPQHPMLIWLRIQEYDKIEQTA